jgi:hypothetical protein
LSVSYICASIAEQAALFNSFVVYPNPTRDMAFVDFGLNQTESVSVSVMDLTGKEIINIPASKFNTGKHTIEIGTAILSEGMYMVRISGANAALTSRLVIIK